MIQTNFTSTQKYDPQTNFLSGHYLFSLGATALERLDLKTGSTIQIKYIDILAVRLDFSNQNEEGLSRRQDSTRTYTCVINERYNIKSEEICSNFSGSYGNHLAYNIFIKNLHQKLIQSPNESRIYTTNFAADDYKVIRYATLGFVITCSILFFIVLKSLDFKVPYTYIIGILTVYGLGFGGLWRIKPQNYVPNDLPTRFLI